jgi:hypothetical protein
MKKLAFDNSKPVETPRESSACKAHGCTRPGSIDQGGGFLCTYHGSAEAVKWPMVTESLAENAYIFDLMRDIKQARNDKAWFALASEFWEEERMKPLPMEKAGQYLYRLHYELMLRAGLVKQNPQRIIRTDAKVKPKDFADEPTYANDFERIEDLKRISANKVRAYMEAHQ